ncbi:MAG TPA: hypothetical protein VFP20_07440 [Bacteroidales bacterium]|nr:hypothetical protein [Bacteroidales bacterium]
MRHHYYIVTLLCLVFSTSFASAQKMTMGFIYPAGGEKGTTTDLEIGGLNLKDATHVLISGEGVKAEIIPLIQATEKGKPKRAIKEKLNDQSSPQLADRIGVRLTIDKKAKPGLRDLRLQSSKGISNKLSIEVGQYPNVLEQKGSSAEKPTSVATLPATLCGQIMPGERDCFSFEAVKGTILVASVKARSLVPYIADAVPGWFQPVIRMTNSKGKEVAYCDDYRNAVDPVIVTTIPETDTYTLTIYDAIYRGREDFDYRIELGQIPFIQYIYPCVGPIGKKTKVTLKGINLDSKSILFKPMNEGLNELTVASKSGFVSNPVPFWGVPKGCTIDATPLAKTSLLLGQVIFDSISAPRQLKTYTVRAEKNENIVLEIRARRLGSMMDALVRLRDPSGKVLVQVDDVEDALQGLMTNHADPVLQYRVKAAGEYTLEVEDVLGNSGSDCYYLIERKKYIPSFQVFVSPADLTIPKGGTAIFRLDISTKEKTIPALDVTLKGLPKGFLVSDLTIPAGSKTFDISITAPVTAKEERLSLQVLAQTRVKGKDQSTVSQVAIAADIMMQAFYYNHYIPAAGFVAEIVPASPFTLRLSPEMETDLQKPILVSPSNTVIPIKIRVNRTAGFKEPIALALNRKMKQLTMDSVTLLPQETEKVILLKVDPSVLKTQRKFRIGFSIVGTVNGEIQKNGKRSFQNALYREVTPIFLLESTRVR